MRVLVCGGRDFGEMPKGYAQEDYDIHRERTDHQVMALCETLDILDVDRRISVLIHGACRTGADRHANAWAQRKMKPIEAYPAVWRVDGKIDKSAGPRRNQRMIDVGRPQLVVAFSGGRGTADMVSRAKKAGIEVIEV